MTKIETVRISQSIKPNRISIIVDPEVRASYRKAVSLNTALWGGIFNPIIGFSDENLQGILEEFGTEFILNLSGKALSDELNKKYDGRFLKESELTRTSHRDQQTKYLSVGFNMLPVYRHLHREEIRIMKGANHFSCVSTDDQAWRDFVAFRYGTFEEMPAVTADYKDWFLKSFEAKQISFDPNADPKTYFEILSPIGITAQGISAFGNDGALSSHVVFVGDHSRPSDLIDYWTLRATGRRILFLPVANFQKWTHAVKHILESGDYPINPQVKNNADVLKAKSIAKEKFEEVITWIREQSDGRLSAQSWFPKYKSTDEHYVGDIRAQELEIDEHDDHVFFDGADLTPLKLIAPEVLEPSSSMYDYHWTTALRLSDLRSQSEHTLLTPNCKEVEGMLGQMLMSGGLTDPMIKKDGPVVFCSGSGNSLYIRPFKIFDVFRAIFREAGLEITVSDPGRYVSQIISSMGGHLHFDCRIFKIRGVRQILYELSEGKTLTRGNMYRIFTDKTPDKFGINWIDDLYSDLRIKQGKKADFSTTFDVLSEKKVIRPGLEFKCATCSKQDWYHISEFDESFKCRYCFSVQRTTLKSSSEWQYKADGIFQVEKSGQGSISVIPALWRICHEADLHNARYIPSFHVRSKDGEIDCEIDYAVLTTDTLSTKFKVVLGEAKSHTDIEKTEGLRKILERLKCPTYIAFSTLKDSFSPTESELLKRLIVDKTPVIPMTRFDLDPYDLFKRFEGLPRTYKSGLDRLSENLIRLNLPGNANG